MDPEILCAGVTATVSEVPGQRAGRTLYEHCSDHVPGHVPLSPPSVSQFVAHAPKASAAAARLTGRQMDVPPRRAILSRNAVARTPGDAPACRRTHTIPLGMRLRRRPTDGCEAAQTQCPPHRSAHPDVSGQAVARISLVGILATRAHRRPSSRGGRNAAYHRDRWGSLLVQPHLRIRQDSDADWLDSRPFDCDMTVASGLRGRPNPDSQANGAMMRISPLGIFGAGHDLAEVSRWTSQDAETTHPHPVCRQANGLFAMAIAAAVHAPAAPGELQLGQGNGCPRGICGGRQEFRRCTTVRLRSSAGAGADRISKCPLATPARTRPSGDKIGTVMREGDADTNAAIRGALLGAVYGREEGGDPRAMDRMPAQLPPRGGRAPCKQTLSPAVLAGGRIRVGGVSGSPQPPRSVSSKTHAAP